MSVYTQADLTGLKPRHDALVGVDSDGCVFPSMDVKQRQCFHPLIIRFWELEAVAPQLRAAAEFVNLRSIHRGNNRFTALLKTFELLHAWPEARAAGVRLPELMALRAYVQSGLPLSNATLAREAERTGDPELRRLLDWSLAVNQSVERTVKNLPPFKGVCEALELIARHADLIVVSQTPEEALIREWREQKLDGYATIIAGQELGTKAEHLALAAQGRYAPERVLMIGDALGDLQAAETNHACFFPVNPGREEESWRRFTGGVFDLFLRGAFAGACQDGLVREFRALLPAVPPWQTPGG